MALIEIDDRDVFNYFTESPIKSKEFLKQWLMELKANNPTVKVITLGNGMYKLDLPHIQCTGSDIETRFKIPFMHELLKMELKHVDASKTDSVNALKYIVQRYTTQNVLLMLYQELVVVQPDIIDEYQGFIHEACQYLFTTNTTNTHNLYATFYIKFTGD